MLVEAPPEMHLRASPPAAAGGRRAGLRLLVWGALPYFGILYAWALAPEIFPRLPFSAGGENVVVTPIDQRFHLREIQVVATVGMIAFALTAAAGFLRRSRVGVWLLCVLAHAGVLSLANATFTTADLEQELGYPDRYDLQWDKLRALRMVDAFSPTLHAFDPRSVSDSSVHSFSELGRRLETWFDRYKSSLRSELAVEEDEAYAVFCLHCASTWWSFGNRNNPYREGCALSNEETRWVPVKSVDFKTYVNSEIGCCSDMAFLMKTLVDRRPIPCRLTRIPGHIFTEVQLGGRWQIFDPSAYARADVAWEDLYTERKPAQIEVTVYPHPLLRDRANPRFRSLTGQVRFQFYHGLITQPSTRRRVLHPELPPAFKTEGPVATIPCCGSEALLPEKAGVLGTGLID